MIWKNKTRNRCLAIALFGALMLPGQVLLAAEASTDQSIEDLLGDPAVYRTAIADFQAGIRKHDAAAVAALVSYPIVVTIAGKKTTIRTAKDFIARYDAIVTPAIAAAIAGQNYDNLFVNSQGVMFGNGEAWINGVCRDKDCKRFDVRVITLQPVEGAAPAASEAVTAAPQKAGVLKSFRDWVVGCDNARSCVAIGMSPDPDAMSGYVKIERSGDAVAVPTITFVTWPDDENAKIEKPIVQLSLDAHKEGGVPAGMLPADVDGDVVRLTLTDAEATDFLAAIRSAKLVTVELFERGKRIGKQTISLSGSSASLLYMDDEQKRVGSVTALSKKGAAAESSLPALPELPVVVATKMTELSDPLPPAPKAIGKPSPDDCGEGPAPFSAIQLDGGQTLWGVCDSAGAYNVSYRYSIVGKEGTHPASFVIPGVHPDSGAAILGNPYVEEDGLRLGSYDKGRGLGDCGDASDWVFDGKAFQPVSYSLMDQCRGVLQEDWPVLYRASVAP